MMRVRRRIAGEGLGEAAQDAGGAEALACLAEAQATKGAGDQEGAGDAERAGGAGVVGGGAGD